MTRQIKDVEIVEDELTYEAFDYFIGKWKGMGGGEPGMGQYERYYEYVLGNQYISVRNKSSYPPKSPGEPGEVHEDWGMLSYDKSRHTYVLRQFHVEGFVNQYVLDTISEDGKQLVFITESIENIAPGWKARETYQILSPNEFSEVFELAAPGGEFELYTQCRLVRQ